MSIQNQISETAAVTASLRALSNYETDERVNCSDLFAEFFLPEDKRTALTDPGSRNMIKKMVPAGLYEYVIARTKYFDQVFLGSLAESVPQIVFLGAGYDSRPYRFAKFIGKTRIFETDAKPTQDRKIAVLKERGVDLSSNIEFVSVDFETDDLTASLASHGFDQSKPALFLWEGVTFYLSRFTVIRMLNELRKNSGPGSRLCFDFQTVNGGDGLIDTGLGDESVQFGIESGQIDRSVRENGYRIVELITAPDMEEKFLTLKNGVKFGNIMPMMHFLLIEHQ